MHYVYYILYIINILLTNNLYFVMIGNGFWLFDYQLICSDSVRIHFLKSKTSIYTKCLIS